MKLSAIGCQHLDPRTDQLYQPLRTALNNSTLFKSLSQQHFAWTHNPNIKTNVKNSQFLTKGSESQQHTMRQSTMIPQNMKLVESSNPLKKMRARTRSYRAISVEETIKRPLNSRALREQIQLRPARKRQIFYDYDYHPQQGQNTKYAPIHSQPLIKDRVRVRPRCVTQLNPAVYYVGQKVSEKKQLPDKLYQNNALKAKTSQTSNSTGQTQRLSLSKVAKLKEIRSHKHLQQPKSPDFSSQYYQHCNKYTFNKAFKTKAKGQTPLTAESEASIHQQRSPTNNSNNYKYNLFSLLDEQTNARCETGFLTKNEFIAPRIQKHYW